MEQESIATGGSAVGLFIGLVVLLLGVAIQNEVVHLGIGNAMALQVVGGVVALVSVGVLTNHVAKL